ncbi:hypothetical protein [Marispirochaeta sp.]|uniref:hypothetical protein n=1 Tax=Marispirochaeta sp. TaxID=2038653 RepID=UPI0029C7A627|nr:hypothetical protein [Marispirochaeta sp.]
MTRWEEQGWQQEDLNKLELSFLHEMFRCDAVERVDATLAYAKYLNHKGVDSDNYPIFLRILEMKNHWVVDALIGGKDPEQYFSNIQPNYYIVKACFAAFASAQRGGIYPTSLIAYLSILQTTYRNPLEGYRVYPPTSTDINHLGKHLNESKEQLDPLNRIILTILDRISALVDPGRPEESQDIMAIATQANNIRGKFLDMTKSLREAIPDELLGVSDYIEEEIPPTGV